MQNDFFKTLNCSGLTGPHAQSSISCLATSLALLLRADIIVSKSPQLTAAATAYGRYACIFLACQSACYTLTDQAVAYALVPAQLLLNMGIMAASRGRTALYTVA